MKSSNLNHYFIGALVIFFVGLVVWFFFNIPPVSGKAHVEIGNNRIEVEIADTPLSRIQGLSGRASLPEKSGMLFIFSEPDIQRFWMGDMRFPLDMIWINGDTVLEVVTLQPPSPQAPVPESWTSKEPADKVLELNAGLAEKLGIVAGSKIVITR
ncbi:MAG: DUF192 domain-containing protein [Patescibacteria group bacterium]